MRNASKHSRQPAARRSASLLLLLPFALATAQAQTVTDAVEPATTAMEPAGIPATAPAQDAAPEAVAAPPVVADTAPPAPRPLVVPVLANEDNAIERQLGARCPNDLAARLATQDTLLIGACQGAMPAHLAALLVAIPEQQLLLPRAARERQLIQKAWFKAVPGYGVRPDFLAVQGGLWVRSFEGPDATTTVYLVSGPFTCVDGRYPDGDAPKTQRLSSGSCREALVEQRVYRVSGTAAPVDITAQVMPAQPLLSDADKKRYGANVRVELDPGKLQFGPVLRWYADVEKGTKPEPRAYGEWGRLHLGFVVWNGEGFEARDTVPRGLWACDPVAPGDAACGGYADAGRDPFVVNASAVAGQSATP